MKLRPAKNSDSPEIIALINSVYNEYGDEIFLEGYDQDLLDIEGSFRSKGGEFIVLITSDKIVGCHATLPLDIENGIVTHRRLYLHPDYRGSESAAILMEWAIRWDLENGFRRIEFWSDTRFERAHKFFSKYGFQKTDEVRTMNDGAMPYSENQFVKDLGNSESSTKKPH